MSAAEVSASGWLRLRTSLLDRLAALVLLPVLGPPIALLAWLVRRREGPPAFVALDRVGARGTVFRMWKLRSMRAEAPDGTAVGSAITGASDDRITPTGAWMRRWRIDELPQLWNVLRGDMGLLGPRPETPTMVDMADPRWREVLSVRPGVAGPTQLVIERWEAETLTGDDPTVRYEREVLPVKLAIDAWYVGGATLWTDLRVGWSMVQRFLLHRDEVTIERTVRAALPEARSIPPRSASRD